MIEQSTSAEWRSDVCARLMNSGCLYVMAWGQDCELWHDAADWALLEMFDFGDIPDDRSAMTTWHSDETLDEVFWFAGHCASHPTVALEETIILHVSDSKRNAELVAQYDVAQRSG